MTPTRCSATTRDGSPCQVQPAPGSSFCPFHDPDRAAAFAAGRSKGGAASHRRPRRFPRVLDYRHVAELLGELFVDALNQADPADPRSLGALNQLSRTLLLAVGHPKATYIHYQDRAEPAPDVPHLLRLYPAAPEIAAPEIAAFAPAAPPPAARLPQSHPSDPSDRSTSALPPPAPAPEPEPSSDAVLNLMPSPEIDDIVRRLLYNRVPGTNTPDLDAWLDRYAAHRPGAVPPARTPDHQEAIDRLAELVASSSTTSPRQARPQAVPQAASQADNKPITSPPATSSFPVVAARPRDTSLQSPCAANHDTLPPDPNHRAAATLPADRPRPTAAARRHASPRRRR